MDDTAGGRAQRRGAAQRFYAPGPGVDEPMAKWENGSFRPLHADERGSVIAHTDIAEQTTWRTAYDDYGVPFDAGWQGRFGYTGQVYLPDARIYHYKARAYDPEAGRFLQRDLIGYDDGTTCTSIWEGTR